ncbi:MAG: hypothetical protein ACRCV9_18875 [Burkholderiaceae bacterium]
MNHVGKQELAQTERYLKHARGSKQKGGGQEDNKEIQQYRPHTRRWAGAGFGPIAA